MKFKKYLSSFLLLLMLVSAMSSCTKKDDTQQKEESQDQQVSSEQSEVKPEAEMSEVTDYEELNKVPTVDNSKDEKKYNTAIKDINISGGIQLTEMAEKGMVSFWPKAMYDVGDDVLLIYSDDDVSGSLLMFKFVSTQTGEQLSKLFVEVEGQIYYVEDIRDNKSYGDNRDIKITTSLGVYFFDLDNLEVQPEEYLFSDAAKEKSGLLVIKDNLGQEYNLSHVMFDMYVPDKKLVYANNEGVFVSDLDGSNGSKIADQPKNKKWYSGSDLAIGTDGKAITGNTMAVYSNPKFMDNGKKIFCRITNYSTNNPNIGFVVIDVETGNVYENSFYDKKSDTGKITDWTASEIAFVNPTMLSDNEVVLTTTFIKSGETSVSRHDVIFDVSKNEISKDMVNRGGLTNNYDVLAINVVKDIEDISATQVAFVDMNSQKEIESGVTFENATTLTVGLSEKYALTNFYKIADSDSETREGFLVLVKIPEIK